MKPEPRTASSAVLGEVDTENSHVSRRKRMTADERLVKNRERNKSHARKTRERKKNHMIALRLRVEELEEESNALRAKVDARYTASVLLGLGSGPPNGDNTGVTLRSSTSICQDLDKMAKIKQDELMNHRIRIEEDQNVLLERCTANVLNTTGSGVRDRNSSSSGSSTINKVDGMSASAVAVAERRAKGKYTPQERETIRRERNRIHAKKTRDKKKIFLESSEMMISTLEEEVKSLRAYLVSAKVMGQDDLNRLEERDRTAQLELNALKDTTNNIASDVLLKIRDVGLGGDDGDADSEEGTSPQMQMSSRSSSSDMTSGSGNTNITEVKKETGNASAGTSSSSGIVSISTDTYPTLEGLSASFHSNSASGTTSGDASVNHTTHTDTTSSSTSGHNSDNCSERKKSTSVASSSGSSGGKRGRANKGKKRSWSYEETGNSSNTGSSDNEGSTGASGSTDGSNEGSSNDSEYVGKTRAANGEPNKKMQRPASLQSLSVSAGDTDGGPFLF